MAFRTEILEACQDYGLVLGRNLIEYAGWRTRGSSTFNPRGSVNHHTAGPRSGDLPSLNTLLYGRTGLPGPLCNAALSRSAKIHLIAAGRANHAGKGGWKGLSGNSSVWGLEVEHIGYATEPVTDAQWDAMYRWHAACCDVSGVKADKVCQHFEWAPTRKIDFVKTITDPNKFRNNVGRFLNAPAPSPKEDDDMPKPFLCRLSLKSPAVLYVDASRQVHWVTKNALAGYQLQLRLDKPADGDKAGDVCVLSPNAPEQHIKDLYNMVINLPAIGELPADHEAVWVGPRIKAPNLDAITKAINALPAKVVAALPPSSTGGLTAEQVKAASKQAITETGLLGLLPGQ